MTETLKEAKPSEDALEKMISMLRAMSLPNPTNYSFRELVQRLYSIDVAPLIAERDALKARVAEIEKERDEARANHFITRVERDGAEDHASETAEELREFRARNRAALAAWREAEADGTTMRQRAESAETSLAALRRQVEIARDYINTHGRVCGVLTPLASEVLSALDAPQPEARSKAIIDDAELPVKGGSISGPAVDAWNNRSDDARDAIIAEAVEVMRTLSPIKDVPIFRDEEPVVLRVGNFGEYVYMPLGAWSIFRAARAFVEKHGGGR